MATPPGDDGSDVTRQVGGGAPPPPGRTTAEEPTPTAAPPPEPSHRSRMLLFGAGALAVSLVVLVVALMVTRSDDGGDAVATTAPAPPDTTAATDASTAAGTTATTTPAPTTAPTRSADPEPGSAEALAASVVRIELLLGDRTVCSGSGTIVETDGTILTNFHVVEQSPVCPHDRIGVAVADSSQDEPTLRYEADLFAADPTIDLAVVRIARTIDGDPVTASFEPVPLGDSDAVELGQGIRVIGYPAIGAETITVTEGTVSGFTTDEDRRVLIKTDATITGGNSGGLAADDSGTLVGVPTRSGTGEGRIVDCRIVTDANDDGRIDQDDSCVPIGGFVNGIKPIALAAELIRAARTATAIDQGPAPRTEPMGPGRPVARDHQWTLGVTPEGFTADPVLAAPAGAPELCLTWSYDGIPGGSRFEVDWYVDGVLDEAASVDGTTSGPATSSFFACISNPNGLADGVYELAWTVDGEQVFTEATFVGGGRAALELEVVNDAGVELCVVQLNPAGTRSYGLTELDEPLPPGGRAVIPLVVGDHVARVIDCDGVVRFEDRTGTRFDGDTTLSIPPS